MTTIYILIPISIFLLLVAILCFNWAVKTQQYDDLDSPASQILFDDVDSRERSKKTGEKHE